jgi:two-component system, NarL family, response regulator DesR
MSSAATTGSAASFESHARPSVELVVDRVRRGRMAAALTSGGCRVVREGGENGGVDAVLVALEENRSSDRDLVAALRRRMPDVVLVVALPDPSRSTVRGLLDAGVDAVVDTERLDTLPSAINACRAGQLVLPKSFREGFGRPALTRREKQVLGLVVMGLSNAEIARRLHLSQSTVKCHLTASFAKLGARSRSEAAALIVDPVRGFGLGVLSLTPQRDDNGL